MTNIFRNPDALVDAVRAIMLGEKKVSETNKNDKSDDGEGLDAVQPKAVKKKFADRKDKDIDNDGDTDSSDEYLHKRRKAISKAVKERVKAVKERAKVKEEDDEEVPCADCGEVHEGACDPDDMTEKKSVKEDDEDDEDEDGAEKTDAQKNDMDGDGEKDVKKKKKNKDDDEDAGKPNKIDTKPEIKTAVSVTESDSEVESVNEKKDPDGGDENFMMALRKAVSLRGQYDVAFKDGKKVKISQKDALTLLDRLQKEKPAGREALMKSAYKSEKHFKMALKGQIEKKKNPLDLD